MKALVLAAGKGTRLGELTRATPKVLLPIGGEPLLAHTIRYLAHNGISEVAVNLHYFAEAICQYLGNGSRFDVRIHYSFEETLLGTAGAVKKLEAYLSESSDFLVIYGDLLIDQPLKQMILFHKNVEAIATLLLHKRAGSNSIVKMAPDGRIIAFEERPPERDLTEIHWVNSGLQILNRRIMTYIPAGQHCDLPRDVYVPLAGIESLFGFPLSGTRIAIDSGQRYQEAQQAFASGRFQYKPET